ncbi:Sterol 3-beta-glucosyltransferase [Lunasporangiospora selenospora]|uniref:sterol 3beta-glucosyltransferase n=1 Tax=Lunasporangiospora selenospora TaxID=979761 RepID=A0A9P6G2Z4_9FUNG|nr:Sterol 3-beta-glucosyltransferase [Lunasporangiospora selenospora]
MVGSQERSDLSSEDDDDLVHVNNEAKENAHRHRMLFRQESMHGLGIHSEGEEEADSSDDEHSAEEPHVEQPLEHEKQPLVGEENDLTKSTSAISFGSFRDKKSVAEKLRAAFEYSCWLARSVLLPGYMYLTSNHICFYANLPSSPDVYYPLKSIDLKHAISAEPSTTNSQNFIIFTNQREYTFKTDSELDRNDWVKAIQKSIFHAKMEGDKVKISIPLATVVDVDMNAMSFAEAIQIKVVESDGSYAVDEYYFAYFDDTALTLNALRLQLKSYQQRTAKDLGGSHRIYDSTSPRKTTATTFTSITEASHRPPSAPASALQGARNFFQSARESGRNSLRLLHPDYSKTRARSRSTSPAPRSQPASDTEESEKEKARHSLLFSIRGATSWITETKPDFGGSSEDAQSMSEKEQDAFRREFALPESENLSAVVSGYLLRVAPLYGRIYLSDNYICFKSRLYGWRTKLIVPLADVHRVDKHKGTMFYFHGLSISTKKDDEIFFEFSTTETRNTILNTLCDRVTPEAQERRRKLRALAVAETPSAELDDPMESHIMESLQLCEEPVHVEPMSWASRPGFAPSRPLHITCLTIGSRGDVQPYIALCKRLMQDGHSCRIATHGEYKDWIEGHGIEFGLVGGDPAELIELCVDNGMFTVSFFREGLKRFRGWLDELMETAWIACQNTDVLIESPSAMAGIHIAEKLDIPYFRAFPFPWTRTRAFPHPFAVPEHNLGRGYNYMTYVMIEQVFWKGISGQVNRWRKDMLGLPPTSLEKMEAHRVPSLYSWSPNVVPAPMDWHSWIHVTGYWFLDNPDLAWTPPADLVEFLEADPNNKPVYIGFGSMVVPDPDGMTRAIIEAVVKSGVRAIVSKGWSDRATGQEDPNAPKKTPSEEIVIPPNVYMLKSVPHDWLFPRLAGCVHHGGAGTTAAGLRAGIPTVIKPYFGDQYFWAQRVEEAGVGVWCHDLSVKKLASALTTITTDEKMIKKAQMIGERIRREDGVGLAVQYFYHDLALAKQRLHKDRKEKSEESSQKFRITKEGENDWWFIQPSSATSGATSANEGSESTGGLNVLSGSEEDSTSTPSDDIAAPMIESAELQHSATFPQSHEETGTNAEPITRNIQTSQTEPGPDRATERVMNGDDTVEELAAKLEGLRPLSRSSASPISQGFAQGESVQDSEKEYAATASSSSAATSHKSARTSTARKMFESISTKASSMTTSVTGYFSPSSSHHQHSLSSSSSLSSQHQQQLPPPPPSQSPKQQQQQVSASNNSSSSIGTSNEPPTSSSSTSYSSITDPTKTVIGLTSANKLR